MRKKKVHILNIDDARICGSKLPGPNTAKAIEGTCQGCIDGLHPMVKARIASELATIEQER